MFPRDTGKGIGEIVQGLRFYIYISYYMCVGVGVYAAKTIMYIK